LQLPGLSYAYFLQRNLFNFKLEPNNDSIDKWYLLWANFLYFRYHMPKFILKDILTIPLIWWICFQFKGHKVSKVENLKFHTSIKNFLWQRNGLKTTLWNTPKEAIMTYFQSIRSNTWKPSKDFGVMLFSWMCLWNPLSNFTSFLWFWYHFVVSMCI
jgi:hypothetical protein